MGLRGIGILAPAWTLAVTSSVPAAPLPAHAYVQRSARSFSVTEFRQLTKGAVALRRTARLRTADGATLAGTPRGIVRKIGASWEPFPSRRPLPWEEVTVLAEERAGVVWVGTTRGLVRVEYAGAGPVAVEYFAGRRWLPADHVRAIGFQEGGVVWAETDRGFGRIESRSTTLAEKAAAFDARLRARHLRHGLVSPARLGSPGDLATARPVPDDNDGLWTSLYAAGECFRYHVTGLAEARRAAQGALGALIRLESITGLPGFPARSLVAVDEPRPTEGEWHPAADGGWLWKGDTSSDEIVGHFFAFAVCHDRLPEEDRSPIRAVVARIADHILGHGFALVDMDGQPTKWGWWGPEALAADPDEAGLRALEILSHLMVAHHITGKAAYREAYDGLVRVHGYDRLARRQKVNVPRYVNHSDDELAVLSFYPLLAYETDPRRRKTYLEGLQQSILVERPERNPLFDFIYAAASGSREYDREEAVRTLQQIPMDLVTWTMTNSHRPDVPLDPQPDRFGRLQSLVVLSPAERRIMKWNENPYVLDGGDGGLTEDDGASYLLPYWMGRDHGLIGE